MFRLIAPITKAVSKNGKLTVRGIASDPTVDRDEERFSEDAVTKMQAAVAKGGIPLRVEHENKIYSEVGEWTMAEIEKSTGKMVVEGVIDTALSLGKDIEVLLNKGVEIALSVGGVILDAGFEYSEELKKHIKVYKDVVLEEISVVKNPSNYNASLSLAKSVDWEKLQAFSKKATTEKVFQVPHTTEGSRLAAHYRNQTKATRDQETDIHQAFVSEAEKAAPLYKNYAELAEGIATHMAKYYDEDFDWDSHNMTADDLSAIKELVKFVDAVQIDKDAPRPVEYDDYEFWDSLPSECFIQLPNMVRVLPHHNKDYTLNPSQLAYAIKEAVDSKSHYTPKNFAIVINHLFYHAKEAGMLKAAKSKSLSNPNDMKQKNGVSKGTAPGTSASEALMDGKELASPTAPGANQGKTPVSPSKGGVEGQAAIEAGNAASGTPGGGKHAIQDAPVTKDTKLTKDEFEMMKAAYDFQKENKELPESMSEFSMAQLLKYVQAYGLVNSALKSGDAFRHEDGSVTLKVVQRVQSLKFADITEEKLNSLTKEQAVELLSRISKGEFREEASDKVEALEKSVLSLIQSNPDPMSKSTQVKKDVDPVEEKPEEEVEVPEEKKEEVPAEDEAKVDEEVKPAEEAAPAEEVKPAEEAAPVEEVKEEVPADDGKPAEEVKSVEEEKPAAKAEEEAPKEEATPAEDDSKPAGEEEAKVEATPEATPPEVAAEAPEAPAAETPASAEEITKAISESSAKLEKSVSAKFDTIAKAFEKQGTETVAKAEQALESVAKVETKLKEFESIVPLMTKTAELLEKMAKAPAGRRAVHSYAALEKSSSDTSEVSKEGVKPEDAVQKLTDEIMNADPSISASNAYKQAKDRIEGGAA